MRVATYSRVSTELQAERGHSLAEQKQTLANYCEKQGFLLIEHVEDAGMSGTASARPGILRLRELARAGAIEAIVCVRIDRLSRKAWLGESLIDEFEQLGVGFLFTDQAIAPGPVGVFLRTILGGYSELEHSNIKARTAAGKTQKARDRQVMPMGRGPFGYKQITVSEAKALPQFAGRDGELVEEPDEAPIVREIFRRYVAGEGLTELCRWLQEDPIAGTRGVWRHGRLKSLLRNSTYCGTRRYLQTQRQKGRSPKPRPEEDHVLLPCLALVEVPVWLAAQARLKDNARNVGRPTTEFLLRGVVFCGVCRNQDGSPRRCVGHRWNHDNRRPGYKTGRLYRCTSTTDFSRENCQVSTNAEKLEKAALRSLRVHLVPGVLAAKARAIAEAEIAATADVEVTAANLEQQLRQLDKEEEKVMDLALSGFEQRLILSRLQPIKRRRQQLREQLAQAGERLARRQDPEEVAARVEKIAEEARVELAEAEAEGDNVRLQRLCGRFVRATLWKKKAADIQIIVPI